MSDQGLPPERSSIDLPPITTDAPNSDITDRAPAGLEDAVQAYEVQPGTDANFRKRLQGDMVRGSLWTLLASIISLPVTFVVSLVVVRSLGAHEYGKFALYTTLFTVAATALNTGVSSASAQWIAGSHARGERLEVLRQIRICAGFHIYIEAPAIFGVTFIVLHHASIPLLLVALLGNTASMLIGTSTVILIATAQNSLAARISLVTTLTTQGAITAGAAIGHTATSTYALQVFAATLSPALSLFALSPDFRRATLKPLKPWGWPNGFRSFAFHTGISGLVGTLVVGRTEIFVLQADGDVKAIALFSVAAALASQITVPIDSLMGPITPGSAALVGSAPALAERALGRALRVTAALSTFSAGLALPVATLMVATLYGNDFSRSEIPLVAMGLVSCVSSAAHPLRAFALATRSAGAMLATNLISLCFDVLLALSLVPLIGLLGAVIANAASQLVLAFLTLRITCRRLDLTISSVAKRMSPVLLGPVAATAGLLAGLLTPVNQLRPIVALLAGLLSLVVGFRCVRLFQLPQEDGDALTNALPVRFRRPITMAAQRIGVLPRA